MPTCISLVDLESLNITSASLSLTFMRITSSQVKEMANENTPDIDVCVIEKTATFQIALMFCTLPFHTFIIKVLATDVRFDLQRHKILFSLSLSDAVVTFGLFTLAIVNKATNLTIASTGCAIYRRFTIFIACSTLVVSSVSIIAMAVERYIACIHSFRLHRILTESRVRNWSICTWIFGVVIGTLAAFTSHFYGNMIILNYSIVQYVYLIFTIPTSVFVIAIQARLFIFSRTKINRIVPTGAFGARMELYDYKRKQIKIAVMAGIVAIAFVVCMIPLAIVFLYELVSGSTVSSSYRSVCLSLSFGNSFADPFIYGFGAADTRRKMLRDFKKLKHFLHGILPEQFFPISRKRKSQTSLKKLFVQ